MNVASAWLLSSGDHHHGHGHGHDDDHGRDVEHRVATPLGDLVLSVFETDHPPVFRVRAVRAVAIETVRPDGSRQSFSIVEGSGYLQSPEGIPESHEFVADVLVGGASTKAQSDRLIDPHV